MTPLVLECKYNIPYTIYIYHRCVKYNCPLQHGHSRIVCVSHNITEEQEVIRAGYEVINFLEQAQTYIYNAGNNLCNAPGYNLLQQ